MKIESLEFTDFRAISQGSFVLDGKSTVLFGANGTGKSSVLKGVNLLYASIINKIVNRTELRSRYPMKLEDITFGKAEACVKAKFLFDNDRIEFFRGMTRKTGRGFHEAKSLSKIAATFQDKYFSDEHQEDIPVFVNYGTNRLVLDIPLRIRTHHEFDIYAAFEQAIENQISFRTFFEWYRNQEDYENQCKIEEKTLEYRDKSLEAVRTAVMAVLGNCTNLRVARKPRLEMKVDKYGMSLNVSQLSDGEKCTMALFGDLARRLALANPNKENPLLGEGVVLIDEIELHMHPAWQRGVLKKLRTTFPNVQFIITTHSPIVLSEIDDSYKVFYLSSDKEGVQITEYSRMDGFDANYILEEFMGTASQNEGTQKLIDSIYAAINNKEFEKAEEYVEVLANRTHDNQSDVITARMLIKRGRSQ